MNIWSFPVNILPARMLSLVNTTPYTSHSCGPGFLFLKNTHTQLIQAHLPLTPGHPGLPSWPTSPTLFSLASCGLWSLGRQSRLLKITSHLIPKNTIILWFYIAPNLTCSIKRMSKVPPEVLSHLTPVSNLISGALSSPHTTSSPAFFPVLNIPCSFLATGCLHVLFFHLE